jgi:hypothetical protein
VIVASLATPPSDLHDDAVTRPPFHAKRADEVVDGDVSPLEHDALDLLSRDAGGESEGCDGEEVSHLRGCGGAGVRGCGSGTPRPSDSIV